MLCIWCFPASTDYPAGHWSLPDRSWDGAGGSLIHWGCLFVVTGSEVDKVSSTELQPGVKNELSGFRSPEDDKICITFHTCKQYICKQHGISPEYYRSNSKTMIEQKLANNLNTNRKPLFSPSSLGLHSRVESHTDHVHHFWVDGLCDDIPIVGDVLHHLAQRSPLYFLPFQITQRVRQEVEKNAALSKFLDEELLLLCRGHVCRDKGRKSDVSQKQK